MLEAMGMEIANDTQRYLLNPKQLLTATGVEKPVENKHFLPFGPVFGKPENTAFSIDIPSSKMNTNAIKTIVNSKSVSFFPKIRVSLMCYEDYLIPLERDLLKDSSGTSYWDIAFSVGKVWKEINDKLYSRASLPFQLSNILENDTHHGIATFIYQGSKISNIFYQVVVSTKTCLVEQEFMAWGWLNGQIESLQINSFIDQIDDFLEKKKKCAPIKLIKSYKFKPAGDYINALNIGFGSASNIVAGLVIDDVIFRTECKTPLGEYPFPASMMFGVWSVTKTAFCAMAYLRLSKIIGQDIRTISVFDLLRDNKKNLENWSDITIGNFLDMCSGIGTAALENNSPNVFGDYITEESEIGSCDKKALSFKLYDEWYKAESRQGKTLAALKCSKYPWNPGEVVRYRDQDLYCAGLFLDLLLKKTRSHRCRLWTMLRDEVYIPSRIFNTIKFHTVEENVEYELPLSCSGLLLSMQNVAALGALISKKGLVENKELLHSQLLDDIFSSKVLKGLPTGTFSKDGEIYYYGATWHIPYRSLNGKIFWIPTMRGYGGQFIQIFPNGMTAFRFAFDTYHTGEEFDGLKLARIADSIKSF